MSKGFGIRMYDVIRMLKWLYQRFNRFLHFEKVNVLTMKLVIIINMFNGG